MNIFTKGFWIYAGERTTKTFLQVFLGGLVSNQLGLLHVDWLGILSLAVVACAGSVLTSVNGYSVPIVVPTPAVVVPAVPSELVPVPVGA